MSSYSDHADTKDDQDDCEDKTSNAACYYACGEREGSASTDGEGRGDVVDDVLDVLNKLLLCRCAIADNAFTLGVHEALLPTAQVSSHGIGIEVDLSNTA